MARGRKRTVAKTRREVSIPLSDSTSEVGTNESDVMSLGAEADRGETDIPSGNIPVGTNTDTNRFPVPNAETESIQIKDRPKSPECRSMITVGSVTPNSFDGNTDVDDWIDHFLYVSRCNNWDERMQVRRIPIYLKGTAELWFRSFSQMGEKKTPQMSVLSPLLRFSVV